MYKEIRKNKFPAFGFREEISSIVDNCSKGYLDEITESLYKLYIKDNGTFSLSEVECISRVIPMQGILLNVSVPLRTGISILNTILSIERESLLRVPYDFFKKSTVKSRANKIPLNFKDFLLKRSDIVLQEKSLEDETTINHPYFNLYRACNTLILYLNQPTHHFKALEKFVENLIENYKKELYKQIVIEEYICLNKESIQEVLTFVSNEIVDGALQYLQLGKTMEEGEVIVSEKRALMKDLDFSSQEFEEIHDKFVLNFTTLLQDKDTYEAWLDSLDNIYAKELSKIDVTIPQYVRVSYQKFIMYTLGKIFAVQEDYEELILKASFEISQELKEQIFEFTIEQNLKTCEFTVAVCVEGVIKKNLKEGIKLTENIEILPHEMFQIWQQDINRLLNRKELFIVDTEEKERSSWFIVKGIYHSKRDTERVYDLACEKIKDALSLVYYLTTRTNDINYKILKHYPYFCFNHTSEILTVGRKESNSHWVDAKNLDELDEKFINFSQEVFLNKTNAVQYTRKAIKLYIDSCMIKDPHRRASKHKELLETIFNTTDEDKVAYFAAVIIAGTNYKKSDITYGQMRRWLFEDFKEYMKISGSREYLAFKVQNEERFRVFCKNIIGTFLFNLTSLSLDIEYKAEDIIKWIEYIYPDTMAIERREDDDS